MIFNIAMNTSINVLINEAIRKEKKGERLSKEKRKSLVELYKENFPMVRLPREMEEAYKEIVEKFPDSEFAPKAQERLTTLGAP